MEYIKLSGKNFRKLAQNIGNKKYAKLRIGRDKTGFKQGAKSK